MSLEVLLENELDGVARLVINRPERRNALGRVTIQELALQLRTVAADPSTRVLDHPRRRRATSAAAPTSRSAPR